MLFLLSLVIRALTRPLASLHSWRLAAERGVSPAVVVVRLPVADHPRSIPEPTDCKSPPRGGVRSSSW